MIGTGRTAMGIVQFAEPGPGDVVAVPAAAGGIGTLLVQYARNAGATVIGLAGAPRRPPWPHSPAQASPSTTPTPAGPGGWRSTGASSPSCTTAWAGTSPAPWSACSRRAGGTWCSAGRRRASAATARTSSTASRSASSAPRCSAGQAAATRCGRWSCAPSPRPPRAGSPPPCGASPVPGRRRPPGPGEPGHDRQGRPGALTTRAGAPRKSGAPRPRSPLPCEA